MEKFFNISGTNDEQTQFSIEFSGLDQETAAKKCRELRHDFAGAKRTFSFLGKMYLKNLDEADGLKEKEQLIAKYQKMLDLVSNEVLAAIFK